MRKWLDQNWAEKRQHAHDLLTKVRLGLLDVETLEGLLGDDNISSIPECKKMLEEVLELKSTMLPPQGLQDIPLSVSHPHWFATRTTIKVRPKQNPLA